MTNPEWIAACRSGELDTMPRGVVVNGRSIVLWRTRKGQVVALDDSCPHQGNALSLGAIVGDSIRCPAHGWAVSSDGWCDRAGSGVPVHTAQERDEMIFVRLNRR
jgi:aminopyrrolnitrin oxygenase